MIRRPLAAIALLAALAAPVAAQNCFDAGFGVSLGADTVDTVYPMQPLGFGFPIGNAMYSHVHVNDHGFVQLSNGGTPAPLASGSPALAAPTVPNLLAAGPAVAAFYADIVLTGGGECFLRSSPTQCTVTWRNVRPRSQPTAPRFTFQLQLLSTGEVRCVYGPGVTNAGPVVVGVTPAGVTVAPPTVNLSTTATSATTATLEAFAAINTFDLGNNTLRLQRAGVGFAHQLLGAPGSACAATTTFGAGCDGLGLDAIGLPGLGNAGFTLRARSVPAISPLALFAFGTLVVNPGVPLGPLLGMTGCTSYCNADIGMFAGAPATPGPAPLGATSTFGFSLPADTALLGATLSGQAIAFSLANPFGLAASNGIELRVGQSGQGLFVAPSPALDMVPIAPGSFAMGSTAGQANEQPVHPVTITYPFWMGRYEVTQGQYQSRIGSNPSYFQGANAPFASLRPVENVSRSDAMAYCQALTTQERAAGRVPDGYQYRLPTEAEWEYCCRAGTTTEWHTGASLTTAQANIQGALANASWPAGQTSIVGSYAPNAWGLHDMHGNVREWCLDAFASYVAGAATDPYVDNNGNRIFRGGSWINTSTASLCRSALRASASGLSYKNAMLGFRVVLAPTLVISESLDLQRIEPGTFLMGSNNGGALGYEAPVHQVTLTRPFWMAKHEVTQADFLAIMGFNPSLFDATYMIDWPNRPVEQTTRADAATYCRLVDAAERAAGRVPPGYQYRLPTEAEWEYCCRAGTATEWNTGATITTAQANYAGAFPASGSWGQGATALVGSYPPNPWGLYDMHGNVWEWCLDQVATYPAGPVVDPYVTSGMYPAIRGGSWSVQSSASVVRSANRGNAATPLLLGGAGFRIVLGPALLP